jgi:hypothetical protein
MSRRFSLVFLATISLTFATRAPAQADKPRGVTLDLAASAVERVKADYFAMDYIAGVEDADRLLQKFPKSRELAAWRVANLARVERPKEADSAANALVSANPNDPWGWFAKTFVAEYATEGGGTAAVLKASIEAYRRAPNNPSSGSVRSRSPTTDRQRTRWRCSTARRSVARSHKR